MPTTTETATEARAAPATTGAKAQSPAGTESTE
jgi:hypothetical protein